MMRILFLDIDGVLMCEEEYRAGGGVKNQFPGKRAPLILDVCRRAGAVIVVSSTWRHGNDTRDLFISHGFPLHSDWRTPLNERTTAGGLLLGELRGHEIKHWLDAHPEVESYAIIDDDSDMLPEQLPWFCKTTFPEGVTADHVDILVEMLNTPRVSTTAA
ncbi:hypothetical protein BH10PSE14_BH10PSE14_06130 [soil metagenome]